MLTRRWKRHRFLQGKCRISLRGQELCYSSNSLEPLVHLILVVLDRSRLLEGQVLGDELESVSDPN